MVLGNRQLLSIFFIVVILLGVFFTMGYVMGRNSGSGGAATAAAGPTGAPASGFFPKSLQPDPQLRRLRPADAELRHAVEAAAPERSSQTSPSRRPGRPFFSPSPPSAPKRN